MTEEHSLNILLIDDEEIVHQTLGAYLRDSGHHVENIRDGASAIQLMETKNYDLALIDIRMPGMDGLSVLSKIGEIRSEVSAVIITGHGNMEVVIQALRLGAADFLTKPVKLLDLDAVLEKSNRIRHLRMRQRFLKEIIGGIQSSEDIRLGNRSLIGTSEATEEVRKKIKLAVESQWETILISGEIGTGKEIVAREIHFMSGEDERPFIVVNCSAFLDSHIADKLFGHIKNAFTGTTIDKAWHFELVEDGTIFLDEIADLSPSAQVKLLRMLEAQDNKKLGKAKNTKDTIRVIAATNVPLEEFVESGNFSKDLFHRINKFSIKLSPLREKRSDIIPLANHFLSTFLVGRRLEVTGFSQEAERVLINYDFPGNVRELRYIVERAAMLCRSGLIEPGHLSLCKN